MSFMAENPSVNPYTPKNVFMPDKPGKFQLCDSLKEHYQKTVKNTWVWTMSASVFPGA